MCERAVPPSSSHDPLHQPYGPFTSISQCPSECSRRSIAVWLELFDIRAAIGDVCSGVHTLITPVGVLWLHCTLQIQQPINTNMTSEFSIYPAMPKEVLFDRDGRPRSRSFPPASYHTWSGITTMRYQIAANAEWILSRKCCKNLLRRCH